MTADPYDPIFQDAAKEWNLDPAYLKAVAAHESSGNTAAVSGKGARGLMQIMPGTAKGLGVTDPSDPMQNIFAGAKYLSEALDKEKTPEDALRYYHGGPDWRNNYGPESQGYVPGVAAHYQKIIAANGTATPGGSAVASAPKKQTDAIDDFLSGTTGAREQQAGTPAASDDIDAFLSGQNAQPTQAPTAAVVTAPQDKGGMLRNVAAGLTDAGANVVNFLSDPAGNLAKVPATAAVFAHDALAPALGYPRFDDETRNMLLGDNVPQPGSKLVAGIGNALNVDPNAVAATTDAQRWARKATGAAGTVALLGPGGVIAPVSGAVGAITGDVAGGLSPEWAKPMAEIGGNLAGAGVTAGVGSVGRNLAGGGGGVSPAIADLAKTARDKYNIPITAPQLSDNSLVRIAADQSAKLPFSGAAGKADAQTAAWHVAAGKEMGEPNATAFTPAVMSAAEKRITGVMDDVANRTSIDANTDPHLLNDLAKIQSEVRSGQVPLAHGGAASVEANIDAVLQAAQHGNGVIPGDLYQKMTQTNSALDRASNGGDVHTAHYNQQIMDALDRAFERSASPDDQAALGEARGQYRAMKTIEPLAAKSTDGTINPADLMTRVNAQSRRFDGSNSGVAYTGGGNLGELARIGKEFMGKAPNSGTGDRLLVNGLAMGGFGGLGAAAAGANPLALAGIPAGLVANRLVGGYLRGAGVANRMINSSTSGNVNALVPPSLVVPALAPPRGSPDDIPTMTVRPRIGASARQ